MYENNENKDYSTVTAIRFIYQAEKDGFYTFAFNKKITWTGRSQVIIYDKNNSSTAVLRSNRWSDETQQALNETDMNAANATCITLYLKQGEYVNVQLAASEARDSVCTTTIAKNYIEPLKVGTTNVTVTSDNEAMYTFTAPAAGKYTISVSENSKATVGTSANAAEFAIDADAGVVQYIFEATEENQQISFYFGVGNASGDVQYPVTYDVTVEEYVDEGIRIGETKNINIPGGIMSYEYVVIADEAGDYTLNFSNISSMAMARCNYQIFVNGVEIGWAQVHPAATPLQITLNAGNNILEISTINNPSSMAGTADLTIEKVEA